MLLNIIVVDEILLPKDKYATTHLIHAVSGNKIDIRIQQIFKAKADIQKSKSSFLFLWQRFRVVG